MHPHTKQILIDGLAAAAAVDAPIPDALPAFDRRGPSDRARSYARAFAAGLFPPGDVADSDTRQLVKRYFANPLPDDSLGWSGTSGSTDAEGFDLRERTATGADSVVRAVPIKLRGLDLHDAHRQLERALVHLDRPDPRAGGRQLQERFGRLRNVRIVREQLLADLTYNPAHAFAPQFAWMAEHDRRAFTLVADRHGGVSLVDSSDD